MSIHGHANGANFSRMSAKIHRHRNECRQHNWNDRRNHDKQVLANEMAKSGMHGDFLMFG
jgi:hypothetical protein